MHGRAENEAVRFIAFRADFVYDIVNNAFSKLNAGAAGNTAAYGLVSDPHYFGLNAFGVENVCCFAQRGIGAAAFVGTAVYE